MEKAENVYEKFPFYGHELLNFTTCASCFLDPL